MLFFSPSFVFLFLGSAGLRLLAIRLEWVRAFSGAPEAILTDVIAAARWAVSLALYGGILLSLSYAVRGKTATLPAVISIALLAIGIVFGFDRGLKNWEYVPPAVIPARQVGGPGLLLGNSERLSSTALVLLRGPGEPGGERVVAIPGRPLQYQAEFAGRDASLASLPQAPFEDDSPWFLKSLAIDFRLNAENLQRLLNEGLLPFLTYTVALILLLCSLSFILKFSAWPLANLFLGCLAFRGILALETFFNSTEMQDVFGSVLQGRLPVSLAVPMIFCGIAFLAYLYSFLVYLAKRQNENDI